MVIFLIVGSNRGSVNFFKFCFHDESRNKEPKLRKVVETKKSNQGGFESFWRQTNTREEPNNEEKRETRPRPEFFFRGRCEVGVVVGVVGVGVGGERRRRKKR